MRGRILIVEDAPENRYVLERVLKKEGYEIIEATSGREAIEKAKQIDPHLVLMDMRLPEMSGYEATRRILQKTPTVPIIAITASSLPEEREKCLALGCLAYFSKPIQYREVVEAALRLTKGQDFPS